MEGTSNAARLLAIGFEKGAIGLIGVGFEVNTLDIIRADVVVVDVRGCICARRAPLPGAESVRGPRMAAASRLCAYRCGRDRRVKGAFTGTCDMVAGGVERVRCVFGGLASSRQNFFASVLGDR